MRILVVVSGAVGDRVAGPEIRAWELARALGDRHEVTVAARSSPADIVDGHRIVPLSRRELTRQARRHDVVLAPVLPPYLFTALRGTAVVTVADQYDPIALELSSFEDQPGIDRILESQRLVRRMQLRYADVIVCAGERQRLLLLEELEALAVRQSAPAVVTVPFGLPAPPSPVPRGALRARFGIGSGDPVVLWWGKVWKWFDAETAVRAIKIVADARPDVRMVISAGKAPRQAFDRSATTDAVRALALRLGLLDRNVFFLDEWVPYESRHELLVDADIGLTLHAATAEAPFAARARYMDYLWSGLPPVLARGDEVAQRFARGGFARLVDPGNTDQTARALLDLIQDPRPLEKARTKGRALADEYRWPNLVTPLAAAVEERASSRSVKTLTRPLVSDVGAYYARRAVDRLAARPRRQRGAAAAA